MACWPRTITLLQ